MACVGFIFPEVCLPHTDEASHRTFWKDIGEVVSCRAGLKLGTLKPAVNRRPQLRVNMMFQEILIWHAMLYYEHRQNFLERLGHCKRGSRHYFET